MPRNPYINLLATAWRYARGEKKDYVRVYFSFMLSNLTDACHPLLYGWMINGVQQYGTAVWRYAWQYGLAYLGLKLLEWFFHGPARVRERKLAFNLSRNFMMELYDQALHLPVKWHQDHHSGVIISRIRKAYEALKDFFQNGFMYIHALAKFVMSFVAMIYFTPLFGGIGLILGAVIVAVIFRFDRPLIQYLHETNEQEHKVSASLFDSLSNINTVITLRLEPQMKKSLYDAIQRVWPPYRKNVTINEWKWFVADMLVAGIYVITITGYIYQQYEPGKVFLIGGLVTLIAYVNQFTSVFHDIAWQYNQIVRYNTDVRAVEEIQQAYHQYHPTVTDHPLDPAWQALRINHLAYSHHELTDEMDKAHSLHDINLLLERGKRIACIGESGSGKSTLLSVLRGLFPPLPGVHMIQGDHHFSNLDALYDEVTLFPQDPEIFENTIRYNITLGLDYDASAIRQACETVAFQEVVDHLPKGLESNIQEKGVNLSGGQKQRLALARGILAAQHSDIILMDEPTSSVDPKTELIIYKRLFQLFENKVMVSALHRLHLLEYFDYIYVIDNGRIVEEGTLVALKKESKKFNDLRNHLE